MAKVSRANYMRERRKKLRQLVFMVSPEMADKLDTKLKLQGMTRAEWFRRILTIEVGEK